MPPQHVDFIVAFEHGPSVRHFILVNKKFGSLVDAYNQCIDNLYVFRSVHLELAYRFVRQFDERPDKDIRGTGGTPFMPYLRKHKIATQELKIDSNHRLKA